MAYGLRMTKPGKSTDPDSDNYTTDVRDFSLTTDYPILKATTETEATVTFASGDTTKTYTLVAGYSYYNEIWCFVEYQPGSQRRRAPCGLVRGYSSIQNDGTNINLVLTDSGTGSERVYGIHFYVFGDSATF